MPASDDQLRQVSSQIFGEAVFYTASNSPYLQGTEIVQFGQLLNYMNHKIRSNTSPVISLKGTSQGWQATGEKFQAFNDEFSPDNLGNLAAISVDVYTVGKNSTNPAGTATYVTWLTSGSKGFTASGSVKSAISALGTRERFDTYISHYAENRDLGQSSIFDGSPFEECDIIEKDPTVLLVKTSEQIVLPANLVQASGLYSSFDGVIEAQDIRRVVDRSSIDLPFIIRSPKGSLSVSNGMKSYQIVDVYDLRQIGNLLSTSPYLDYVSIFGAGNYLLDQPGAFSDASENLSGFSDRNDLEDLYSVGAVDPEIRSLILSGVSSGSLQYLPPDTDYLPTYTVAARRGFVFSQNDNYGYDSIAFGGLKK